MIAETSKSDWAKWTYVARNWFEADNQVKTLYFHDRKPIASGPPSESFKSTFGGKSLWILFHIELSFSLSRFFLLITSCLKHIITTSSESTPR